MLHLVWDKLDTEHDVGGALTIDFTGGRAGDAPLAHMSIELGHLYMEDFEEGPERLKDHFAKVASWARTARETIPATSSPRVSTCFLIDDYFTQFSSPGEVIPVLLAAAAQAGLEIDYLARESACAQFEAVPLARMVAGRIDGESLASRPPTTETGWLCSGVQPVADGLEAMYGAKSTPGGESVGVFVDVELWRDHDSTRKFSCAYLASIWQLLRLGMLRYDGTDVVHPRRISEYPRRWDELPPVAQLNLDAAPFCADRTFSVLPSRFLQVEHAVRVILSHVPLPGDVTNRIEYVLFDD